MQHSTPRLPPVLSAFGQYYTKTEKVKAVVKAQGVLHGWGAHIFASCANAGIPLCTLHFPPLELVSAARVRDLVGRQAIDGHVLRGAHTLVSGAETEASEIMEGSHHPSAALS